MFKNMKWFWKVYKVIVIIMILVTLVVFAPILIKYKGKIMIDVGVYNGSEYAFGNGKTSGVFRKTSKDKDFKKISDEVPLGDDLFFFKDDFAIFTNRAYEIVKINLITLEENYYKYENMSLGVVGLNNTYVIAVDYNNDAYIKILDLKTMEVKDSVDMIPYKLNVGVTETYIEFEDYKSRERYKYFFSEKEIIKSDSQG